MLSQQALVNLRTVVVTGGAGFIGSHLVDALLSGGAARVVVMDNLSRGKLSNLDRWRGDPRLCFLDADVRDEDSVARALKGADTIFHLAAHVPPADPCLAESGARGSGVVTGEAAHALADAVADIAATNVSGTVNVLRGALKCGVGRVVFASSADVYGEPLGLPVEESHPLRASEPYGASKIAGEAFCWAFRRGFDLQTAVLRLSTVYGPRDMHTTIPAWLELARSGQDLIVAEGNQLRDFVWVGQAVEAILRAASVEMALPPINVGSGTGTWIVDAARRIARATSGRSRVKRPATGDARGFPRSGFVANVDRMRQLLRVEPPLDPLSYLPGLLGGSAAVGAAG